MKTKLTDRWSGPITVNQVVWEAAAEFTRKDTNVVFTKANLKPIIEKKHPDFKMVNIGSELSIDCINSDSKDSKYRGKRRYWRVEQGTYRLYDAERDKVESDDKVS